MLSQGAIVSSMMSSITLCLGYCACQGASSLCGACFGNSDPSSTGRKRSILLLAMTVFLALIFQYSWAPSLQGGKGNSITRIPFLGSYVLDAWNDTCQEQFEGDPDLITKCQGNAGVYRATFASTFFFLLMAVGAYYNPSLNRSAWPAKYTLFLLFVASTFIIPNSPLFFGPFLSLSRLGACLFLVMQQIILIDLAYSWNESWVQNSLEADSIDYGSGGKWLIAIVSAIVLLYSGCIGAIIYLYKYFSGCPTNDALISITLILIIAVTAVQLNTEGGNLLTSSVMSVYAVYLVGSAVSHNPNEECNPWVITHQGGNLEIIIGLTLTFISLVWTGWSWTEERVFTGTGYVMSIQSWNRGSSLFQLIYLYIHLYRSYLYQYRMKDNPNSHLVENERPLDGLDIPMLEEQSNYVGGVVMDQSDHHLGHEDNTNNELCKLNIVLALVSCWITVSLTGWGSVHSSKGNYYVILYVIRSVISRYTISN